MRSGGGQEVEADFQRVERVSDAVRMTCIVVRDEGARLSNGPDRAEGVGAAARLLRGIKREVEAVGTALRVISAFWWGVFRYERYRRWASSGGVPGSVNSASSS